MFPVIEGSNHVPLYSTCLWEDDDVLCCFVMLFMMNVKHNKNMLLRFFCSQQMEIDERRSLALHRLDSALFAVLGNGSSSLFPSLLSCRHFQLYANRYRNVLFTKQLNFQFYFCIKLHKRKKLCKCSEMQENVSSSYSRKQNQQSRCMHGTRGACAETIFEMKLFALQTNFNSGRKLYLQCEALEFVITMLHHRAS